MKGFLVLESGQLYRGDMPYFCEGAGELVFNTSHAGYEEVASDPSYFGQIVVMTFPMQGNYASCQDCWQGNRLWVSGIICLQMQSSSRDRKWSSELERQGVPLLREVDTRKVVLHLRSQGTLWAAVVGVKRKEEEGENLQSPEEEEEEGRKRGLDLILKKKNQLLKKNWFEEVVTSKKVALHSGALSPSERGGSVLAMIDFGCKKGLLEEVRHRGSEVHLYPPSLSSLEELKKREKSHFQALFLSNGPGDPAHVSKEVIEGIRALIGKWPIMGVCFGHQVLARALGAQTFRLKFGHRGSNHPIKDKLLNCIYMTSQNHGYVVDSESLPAQVERTHWNLNDGSLAGFLYREKACFAVQFHPESCPGPRDAACLFSYFFTEIVSAF